MNSLINRKVEFRDLGKMDYKEAWDYQTALFEKTISVKLSNRNHADDEQQATPNYLLFVEHPHVYTLGKSGDEKNLLIDDAMLGKVEADFYRINRGGDITYHGPGQLVGYPIIDLENFFTDIHRYMRSIEETMILTLDHFGLEGERSQGMTGVWLDTDKPTARKICAIGVKTSRWVTMHGFALNVSTDLNYFGNIVPCGIQDKAVTSLSKELGREVSLDEVKPVVRKAFAEVFGMDWI